MEDAGVRKRKRDREDSSVVAGISWDGAEGGGCCEKELSGDEEEDYEGIAEELVEEVMRWLEMEISLAPPGKDDGGFVTINGNEESCGSSFSAATSTMMASVDTRTGVPPPPTSIPWPWLEPEVPHGMDEEEMNLGEFDDEWLAELLADIPVLEV